MANSSCIIVSSISRNRPIRRYSELTKMAERPMPANTPGGAIPFAHLLEEYRQRAGLSLGQLAQAARLSRTYVYHLERGQRSHPSAHAARALARALELKGAERQTFYRTVEALTGESPEPAIEEEPDE